MTTAPALQQDNETRDYRLRVYMRANSGSWIARGNIMHACGFDNPKSQPVGAYVQFQNSLIRVNQQLKAEGLKIARSEDGAEIYSLISTLEAV
ncbi:hypothetical protein [Pseudochrobactrum sp. XF203]|uniref:hypothetical protein n=1 Tax=Pseudochrobactrum sp. XF203 TaxID=2879116 RepID=UPI001CE2FBB0|nr:hypothetical protein [Pseudochrobactrum sp. XF203]UCA47611.1 hypothetical protein LDL70_16280 [Pseudochrobactrum sp. XF203]